MEKHLPTLAKMQLTSLLSIRKGVKNTHEGIHIKQSFKGVTIEEKRLKEYNHFIGFSRGNPLAYLYLLAQRAQLALMLEPSFTIAIPGIVHVENSLQLIDAVDYNNAFNLEVSVEVPYKIEGSLVPVFYVRFFQKEKEVAFCKSVYLAKRKSKKKKAKKEAVDNEADSFIAHYSEEWAIAANRGKQYAKVSGDSNPIHTRRWFAKLSGFKHTILHGWCAVSHIAKQMEEWQGLTTQSIDVTFKNPIYLPSTQLIHGECLPEGGYRFRLVDKYSRKISLEGKFIFM